MWFMQYSLLLLSVFFAEAKFGFPYLKNTRLCQPWNCVNMKLGLPMLLPPREQYASILKKLLAEDWHQALGEALDVCYGSRPRTYINTCPGQALLQCTVDNLIENCPEESWRKDDACYPVSTLAGWNYMFSQSRYKNLSKRIPKERRPVWFLKQYFSSKCCNLPHFLNSSMISECGFDTFLKYYDHDPWTHNSQRHFMVTRKVKPEHEDNTRRLLNGLENTNDPLDCCDMKDFIAPSWRLECDFQLSWTVPNRLNIEQNLTATTASPSTTTTAPVNKDVKVVPLSCKQETCVFQKLNVISGAGVLDMETFIKFLDNFTTAHQTWTKAKARVLTQCVNKNSEGYESDCEINKLLSCTFDVLTENCPSKVKLDICRSSRRDHTVCQISTSKYRPKYRRSICGLPNMVDTRILEECNVTDISTMKLVPETNHKWSPKKATWRSTYECEDSSPSTLCIMSKMGILNQYSFLDYFKMKDHIRSFTGNHAEWSPLQHIYLNYFAEMPLYDKYCSSPKKLLNVLDAMLMTCPISKRKNSAQCDHFFKDTLNTPPGEYRNMTGKQLDELLRAISTSSATKQKKSSRPKKYSSTSTYTVQHPIFEYGVLSSKNEPKVKIIDVKNPPKAPLVILPVYMRTPYNLNTRILQTHNDGIFQSTNRSEILMKP